MNWTFKYNSGYSSSFPDLNISNLNPSLQVEDKLSWQIMRFSINDKSKFCDSNLKLLLSPL